MMTLQESSFHFDIKETRKKGHDFKDYICPDTMEFEKDYFKMGNRYGRVLFLREYASYIKDSMVAELTDMNRNLMMSIDIVESCAKTVACSSSSRVISFVFKVICSTIAARFNFSMNSDGGTTIFMLSIKFLLRLCRYRHYGQRK